MEAQAILVNVRGVGVSCLSLTPFIHVHYYLSDPEALQVGYTIHEFCCHLCGKSLQIYADFRYHGEAEPVGVAMADQNRMKEIYFDFQQEHRKCYLPVEEYLKFYQETFLKALLDGDALTFCPEVRSSWGTQDFRREGVVLQ